jgi:hypothetical protein
MNGARIRTRGSPGRWLTFHRSTRAGGARRRLLTFLVVVVGAVALLPFVVAKTPLRNILFSSAVPGDAIRVTVRDASLSWFRGPALSGVKITDAVGNTLMTAERIGDDRGPLDLLMNWGELGVIEIVRPIVHIQVRPDGSNLEDVAQKLFSNLSTEEAPHADPTAKQPLAFAVQLVEGTIHVEDLSSSRRWRVDDVNAQYDTHGATAGIGRGSLSGQVIEISQRGEPEVAAGRFSISLQPADAGREQLTFQADALSLAAAEPWLQRVVGGGQLSGTLTGQGTAAWATTAAFPAELVTSGAVSIDRLDAGAPALRGDRVRLSRVELPWRLTSQPSGLAVEDLQLRSDVGHVAMRGRLDPNLSAARHDLELRGAVDVARLAAMLPHALRIRENTTITSGIVELAGRYQPSGEGQLITGSLRTSQLAATNAGRQLRWDEPVNANFAVRRQHGALQVDTLKCDSKFLNIDAHGNLEQFSANASFDLNNLAEQLGQFVDLSEVRLGGTGTTNIEWQQTAGDQFTTTATGEVSQLVIALDEGAAWSEPQLSVRAEAAGLLDPRSHRPIRVDTANLQLTGQGDELDARLLAAVGLMNDTPVWPISVRVNGRIARWLTRVRPWFTPDPWNIDGQSELTATLRVAANYLDAADTKLVVTNLRADAPGWRINEPRLELAGDARWNGASGELTAGTAHLVTSTVSLATRDVRYRASDEGVRQLTGAAAFRADLARLSAWRAATGAPAQYQPSGELTGNVRFAQAGDRISGELTTTGQNLALASRTGATQASRSVRAAGSPGHETIWQEPKLTLRALANYESAADRLAFEQLQIESNTLQAAASGKIEKLSSTADVNLTGTLNYDLAQVTPLLRPYLGTGIQLAGREQARFALAGNLNDGGGPRAQLTGAAINDPYRASAMAVSAATTHWSRRVRAQLELPWSGANVYGLPVGAGRLAANLGDGALRIEPLSLAVGEGRLTAAPQVRFDPQPAELNLPAGPIITNVRISPEVSEAMLKYVAPVLAGATQSEGQFSMQLDSTRVPLAEPRRADSAGRLTVHSVRVVPGPLARELITLAQQIEALAKRRDPTALAGRPTVTLLSIRDQQVNFRAVDGRVHHQNMEFQVGDVTLRSQGSVGFDETLSLTLHVPIQDAWVAKEPLLAGLKGQSLQVPVSGTLTRPQLDQRAVASLSGQLIQNAAGQAIGGELNKALDKLFKSR